MQQPNPASRHIFETCLENRQRLLHGIDHFFPKKDMMLPCPDFPPIFFALPVADDNPLDAGILACSVGGVSFSEKDSQVASSLVTTNGSLSTMK